jgi:hypothetical protein
MATGTVTGLPGTSLTLWYISTRSVLAPFTAPTPKTVSPSAR